MKKTIILFLLVTLSVMSAACDRLNPDPDPDNGTAKWDTSTWDNATWE